MRSFRAALAASTVVVLLAGTSGTVLARVRTISPALRVGPVQGGSGDGLLVRFRDITTSDSCSLTFCARATDTVTVATTVMGNVNFLLNQGCTFGPFNTGCSYFETRWDSYLNVKAAGDYIFSMQVDDGASVAIGDSLLLRLDGGHWFENVTSDTIRFVEPGTYPFRAYYFDCPVCCRGFRLGAMGPSGSGMLAFTPGFDFNADLGPCCTFGGNGPGASVIPASLFYRTSGVVGVELPAPRAGTGAIAACWPSPNPFGAVLTLSAEFTRDQRVWLDLFDAGGRRLATLAAGERYGRGVSRWEWSPGAARAGAIFYRLRTEDGSAATGRLVTVQ